MPLGLPSVQRRRRPAAVGPLRCNTRILPGEAKQPPKHAWWKGLLSWEKGPPTAKDQSVEAPVSVEPSAHLKWAQHVKSVQTEWMRQTQSSTGLATGSSCSSRSGRNQDDEAFCGPSLQRGRKPSSRYGAAYCFTHDAGARIWVQGLREDDELEPVAAGWQEVKKQRLRKDRALQRQQVWQARWRQQEQAKKAKIRSIAENVIGKIAWKWDNLINSSLQNPVDVITELQKLPFGTRKRPLTLKIHRQGEAKNVTFGTVEEGVNWLSDQVQAGPLSALAEEEIDEVRDEGPFYVTSQFGNDRSSLTLDSAEGDGRRGSFVDEDGIPLPDGALTGSRVCTHESWHGSIYEDEEPSIPSRSISRNSSVSGVSAVSELLPPMTPGAGHRRVDTLDGRMDVGDELGDIHGADDQSLSTGQSSTRHGSKQSAILTPDRPPETHRHASSSTLYDETQGLHAAGDEQASKRTSGASSNKQISRQCSQELWDEWIAEFPIDTLDTIADFWESYHVADQEGHVISLPKLQSALKRLLGFPAQVVTEQAVFHGLIAPVFTGSSDIDSEAQTIIKFASLPSFLSLIRDISHWLERERTQLLYPYDELKNLKDTFDHHANAHGRVQMALLFDIIQELCFQDLDLGSTEEQQWLADVTRKTMQGRKTPTNHSGTISFDDFIRIVTAALREKERRNRLVDFQRERAVRKEAGFSSIEMEDLRELHRTYMRLEMPGDKAPAAVKDPIFRMSMFLEGCIPSGLSDQDARKLTQIIRRTQGMDRIDANGFAPFDVFMLWMKEIFAQGLGNLQWVPGNCATCAAGAATEEDLVGRKGFATAMMREEARAIKKQQEPDEESDLEEMKPFSRQTSEVQHSDTRRKSRPGSKQSCVEPSTPSNSRTGSSHGRGGHRKTLADRSFARQATKDLTNGIRRHSGQPDSEKHSRKRSTSAQGRSHAKSMPGSAAQSRRNSGAHERSRGAVRSSSRCSAGSRSISRERESPPDESSSARGPVLLSNGLPPGEAMLRHKSYRAPSVDMTSMLGTGLPAPLGIAEGGRASPSRSALMDALPETATARSSIAVGSVASQSHVAAHEAKQSENSWRKQKSGMDSTLVINQALARLENSQDSPPAAMKGVLSALSNFSLGDESKDMEEKR